MSDAAMTDTYEVRVGNKTVRKDIPAGATNEQIRAAFREVMKQHGINSSEQAVIATPKSMGPVLRDAAAAEMKSYNPTWAEKARYKVSDLLAGLGVDRREANRYGERLTSFLNDWTPAGNVLGIVDADSELEAQLSMLPLPGPTRQAVGKALKGIRAFHGSPHDFDKFDLRMLGTGEGNHAYGEGVYFAENPGVAGSYVQPRGVEPREVPDEVKNPLRDVLREHGWLGFDSFGESLAAIRSAPLSFHHDFDVGDPDRVRSLFDAYESARWPQGKRPRLYEVNINAKPDDFIDHDAIGARNAFRAAKMGDAAGIKYLDQNSRLAGQGSRNYVVFDPSIVDIVRKY